MHQRLLPLSLIVMFFTISLGLIFLLIAPPQARADCGTDASSCKVCHEGNQQLPVNQVGIWHRDHAFGDFCASCHGGDKGSADKALSHANMRNPVLADPQVACETCHGAQWSAKAALYQQKAKEEPDAPAAAARELPPPGSNNGLFVGLNGAMLLALAGLIWAWEKGPLARFTVRRYPPMAGSEAALTPRASLTLVNPLTLPAWSPYLAGAGLGLVAILALWISGQPLGSSGAFQIAASALVKWTGTPLADAVYFKAIAPPRITWQVMLVIGIPVGAFLSAWLSRDFRFEAVPIRWAQVFGTARWKRWLTMFLGGAILQVGASIAGGCTSGLAIAGSMQLAGAGFLFIAALFLTGIITARLLYGKEY